MQENIPISMGRALSGLSAADKMVDNKTFLTWESVVDKYAINSHLIKYFVA